MTDHIKTVTLTPANEHCSAKACAEQIDHAVTQAMDRAIPRLQKLHAHAGRPAWDQVLREEIAAAIHALPLPPNDCSLRCAEPAVERLEASIREALRLGERPHYGDHDDALDHYSEAMDLLRKALKGEKHE